MNELLRFCQSEQAWLLETIAALVRCESPSDDKPAVDRCGAELERRLSAIGGRVERLPQPRRGDHLRATFGAGDRQVLVLGHFDTVWRVGDLEGMPFVERDGRLYGPGVFDMKSGIAVAMLAARALAGRPGAPTLVMLWTTDEEVGSGSSRAAIEAEARRSAAVLVLEPSLPGGAAKTSRKGCGEFELVVHGVPAHAGLDPGRGASAIVELAHQVLAIAALQDLSRGISTNVGIVQGGTRPNVVAAEARARIDVRVPALADVAAVERALRGLTPRLAGTRLEVTGGVDRPPLERSDEVVPAVPAGATGCRRTWPRSRGGERRRRLRREFHRRARCSDIRWPRARRRRSTRPSRARGRIGFGVAGGARGRPGRAVTMRLWPTV